MKTDDSQNNPLIRNSITFLLEENKLPWDFQKEENKNNKNKGELNFEDNLQIAIDFLNQTEFSLNKIFSFENDCPCLTKKENFNGIYVNKDSSTPIIKYNDSESNIQKLFFEKHKSNLIFNFKPQKSNLIKSENIKINPNYKKQLTPQRLIEKNVLPKEQKILENKNILMEEFARILEKFSEKQKMKAKGPKQLILGVKKARNNLKFSTTTPFFSRLGKIKDGSKEEFKNEELKQNGSTKNTNKTERNEFSKKLTKKSSHFKDLKTFKTNNLNICLFTKPNIKSFENNLQHKFDTPSCEQNTLVLQKAAKFVNIKTFGKLADIFSKEKIVNENKAKSLSNLNQFCQHKSKNPLKLIKLQNNTDSLSLIEPPVLNSSLRKRLSYKRSETGPSCEAKKSYQSVTDHIRRVMRKLEF